MKSTEVDESLSSIKQQFCSRENQLATITYLDFVLVIFLFMNVNWAVLSCRMDGPMENKFLSIEGCFCAAGSLVHEINSRGACLCGPGSTMNLHQLGWSWL